MENVKDDRVWWGISGGNSVPAYKRFLSEVGGIVPQTIWGWDEVGHTDESKKELDALFDGNAPFDTPKPARLLKRFVSLATKSAQDDTESPASDIILDFFAGSGTTEQAVLDLNAQDGGNRQFILVQIPEPTGRKDYPTIADITKERVRRVIAKMEAQAPPADKLADEVAEAAPGYLSEPTSSRLPDRGFRVLALEPSNLKKWDPAQSTNLDLLEAQLTMFADTPLVDDWKPDDLLVEVMLWEGFSLTSTLTKKRAGTDTFVCVSDVGMNYRLWCCFDRTHDFTLADIKDLGSAPDDIFVFLDSSLTNTLKSRLTDLVKLKVV